MIMRNRIRRLTYGAVFIALTAMLSQISVPLPYAPVPVNLAIIAVLLCGAIMGARDGAFCMVVYVLLGITGVPVFANFAGGIGTVAGPTGGYIIGYIGAAFVAGVMPQRLSAIAMALGVALCYFFGMMWFLVVTKTSLWAAAINGILPFIAADALKILLATFLVKKLRKQDFNFD